MSPARANGTALSKAARSEIFRILAEIRPEPRGELDYRDPFELLVAVMLSAQATDRAVNRVTPGLFAAAPTPEAMLSLGEAGVAAHIKSLGLWRAKAKNLIATCRALAERGGKVPDDMAELRALPGVGIKTASVVLNLAFGQPVIAVDTHIFRVCNRTGLAPGKTPEAVMAKLMSITPPAYRQHAHHWLLLHGRYCCRARRPDCPSCPIHKYCRWPAKTPIPAFSI